MNGTRSTASRMQMTPRRDRAKGRSRAGCLLAGTLSPGDTILQITALACTSAWPLEPTPGPRPVRPLDAAYAPARSAPDCRTPDHPHRCSRERPELGQRTSKEDIMRKL